MGETASQRSSTSVKRRPVEMIHLRLDSVCKIPSGMRQVQVHWGILDFS